VNVPDGDYFDFAARLARIWHFGNPILNSGDVESMVGAAWDFPSRASRTSTLNLGTSLAVDETMSIKIRLWMVRPRIIRGS
jgi:hypothetical protein